MTSLSTLALLSLLAVGDETAPAAVQAPQEYSPPRAMVKVGIGFPYFFGVHVESFLTDRLSVGAGVQNSLGPSIWEATVRWRPAFAFFGQGKRNFLSFGAGFDPGFSLTSVSDRVFGLQLLASLDVLGVVRFAEHFGLSFGAKVGAGVAASFAPSFGSAVNFAFQINLLEVGLVF